MGVSGLSENTVFQNLIEEFHKEKTYLGPHAGYVWKDDPKHILFQLSRAKFCAQLGDGLNKALDVGCGDGTAINLVSPVVGRVVGIGIHAQVLECNLTTNKRLLKCSYLCADISEGPLQEKFDAAYSLDVLEHIPKDRDNAFIENISKSLVDEEFCIIGTPNIQAVKLGSEHSQIGHINLKGHRELERLLA